MNDIEDGLQKCNIMLYADDAVLFTSSKNSSDIEEDLNLDSLHINRWFIDNNLIVNLKKGKTEFILFGTAQKLKKLNKIEILFNNNTINETSNYEYPGVVFDKSLIFSAHLDRVYKKAASRVKLLSRIRCDLNPYVAEMIYKMMISPILFYCSNVFLACPTSKLQTLQDRSYRIVYHNKNHHKWLSIANEMKRRCARDVFKCVKNIKLPLNFIEYFSHVTHGKNTRGNNNYYFKFQGVVFLMNYLLISVKRYHMLDLCRNVEIIFMHKDNEIISHVPMSVGSSENVPLSDISLSIYIFLSVNY